MSVAKLLYLSKRSRLDILTAVGFLCTRVTKVTAQDKLKVEMCFGIFKVKEEEDFTFENGRFAEACSFCGCCLCITSRREVTDRLCSFYGKALLFVASRKQKCVSKSPTDSELIALSDNIYFV